MASQQIFARKTSGLVREMAPHQAFIYNFMAIGLCTFTWVTLYSIAYSSSFLGASVGLAILLMAIVAIPFYTVTAMLSSAMPRSGGDYVWQSRVLHPLIGFGSTFSAWTIWQWYFAGFLGMLIATLGFQPYFALLGQTNPYYANLAAALAANFGYNTPNFIITTVIIILGLIIAALGMKFYVRLQYILFAGSVVSALAILFVLATTSHAAFVQSFNSFTAPLVQAQGNQTFTSSVQSAGGYYQFIIQHAAMSAPPFSWANTISLWGIIWVSFGYAFWSIYNLSEIKSAGSLKVQVWIQVGSSLAFAIFLLALWWLLESVVGLQFLYSFYTLFYNFDPSTNPLAFFYTPYYPAFVASLTTNPIIWALILVGLTFGIFQVILIVYFASTRIIFAASMDRVLPEKLSYVTKKTRTPLVALVISAIGCEAFLYLIIYYTALTSYFSTAGLATQIAYVLISVTGILFPYRKKQVYEASPAAKYKVAGVPLLTIMGVISLIVNLYIGWLFVAGPAYGYVTVPTSSSIEFIFGIFVACILVYVVAWGVRKKQGIDLGLSFAEMPPV